MEPMGALVLLRRVVLGSGTLIVSVTLRVTLV